MVANGSWQVTVWGYHEQAPRQNQHQQSHGCLVDFRDTLDGYEKVAYAENDNYR
jgi:hypothetical protein